jgi:small-conductance mechanosensitive channel
VARYVTRRLTRRPPRDQQPPFVERAVSAAWVAPVRIAPALLFGLIVYAGLDALELLYPPWDRLGTGLIKGLLLFVCISTLLATVFAVREPQWRLFDLSTTSAQRVCRLLQGIAAVYTVDLALTEMARAFFIPLAISILQSLVACLAFAALLIALLLTRFEPLASQATMPRSRHHPSWLKLPLWLIAAGIGAGALTGYMALARFVAQQLVMTGIVVLIAGLLYLAIRSLTREPVSADHAFGHLLESRFGLDQPRRHQLARLTELSLALVLVLCALPLVMLQWGFSGADIRDWFRSLFFGFEIGQFKISLARILIGLVLFTLLLLGTRLFQRWLRDRVLQQPRMDPGIANSIETVVGYVGIFLAALIAVSYAGLDITNFAIVAGALSFGIGFGLQAIVNNFVSGLVLLIERPIKVGDWIVVGNEQGNVRRISVRATEIETFDRASLIVPNSELITGRVLNWTHRNLLGRVVLKIGVDYAADPDKVMQILRSCADNHPLILKTPEPKAVFEGFGPTSLEFSLRFLLGDLNRSIDVQSEMRASIFKALREHGITIPHTPLPAQPRAQDIAVAVGVGYSCDPERVLQVLRRCAQAHPRVVATPAPIAVFEGIGPSSLNFTLRVTVDDPAHSLEVQSELRIAMLQGLRADGIEIPYAQHDVHLRDLDGLRALINRAAEQKRAGEAKPGPEQPAPASMPASVFKNTS